MDHLHRQDDRVAVVQRKVRSALAKIADAPRWRKRNSRWAPRAACWRPSRGGDARGAAVGRHLQRRRHQGARRFRLPKSCAPRHGGSGSAWASGDHRRDVALRRTVRHRLGHHEQFHRHFEIADHELAVVAPGIAEALLATAIGLVAAIPAVIIYNHFSRVTKGYLELVNWPRRRRAAVVARSRPYPCRGQRARGAAE